MRLPFSFLKASGGPPYDPSLLNATSWKQAPYAGLPWNGAASAGISGTIKQVVLTTPPPIGGSLRGIDSARMESGVHQYNTNDKYISAGYVDIGDLITASEYTTQGVFKVVSAAAAQAASYANGNIVNGDARWGITFDATNGIGVFHYTGAFPSVTRACSIGSAHSYCVRYGGGIGAGMVQIDIDGSPGTPTALANIAVLAGVQVTSGSGTYTTGALVMDEYERMTLKTAISDADRDGYVRYCRTRYGTP